MPSHQNLSTGRRNLFVVGFVVLLLAGLPLAVWLDLRNLTENALQLQASNLNSVISSVRGYYAKDVVGRILAAPGVTTQVIHTYHDTPGAIPIPATLSLELGKVISEQQDNITYRFVSDLPFKGRDAHPLDALEANALASLRANPKEPVMATSWSGLTGEVRLIAPILMGQTCVNCHNTHPDSPKTDWKVGDVRGIQEVTIHQRLATHIWSFRYLMGYFLLMGAVGASFIGLQRHQAKVISDANQELETANQFLASVSVKISRYISPQIYKSIFSGEKDVLIHTERKKLTIFFSDIKDFTSTAERLQPEELTALLNEYFTEMSAIAFKHGGTIDKFIGDAILVFFGDPDSKGVVEDAKACVRMAVEMQARLDELNVTWRRHGIANPFRVRIGINTGYCNVGNFGSSERMDYTIIGAEANLAARLQSIADAGKIIMSYETFALVSDIASARELPPITMKGISHPVVPYALDALLDDSRAGQVFTEQADGIDFYLDVSKVDSAVTEQLRALLLQGAEALKKRGTARAEL